MAVHFEKKDSLLSKQAVVLYGSPHLVGSTFRLLYQFQQQLEMSDTNVYHFHQFNLFDLKLLPCNDCGFCKHGLCHMNHIDGYNDLIEALQVADLVVVATPVYFGGYPAPLKIFFDRLQQFYVQSLQGNQTTFPKIAKGLLLATSGRPDEIAKKSMCHTAKMFFRCINATFEGNLFYDKTDQDLYFNVDCKQWIDAL